jgi:hypothetical protein
VAWVEGGEEEGGEEEGGDEDSGEEVKKGVQGAELAL